jgi:hypothetical protein
MVNDDERLFLRRWVDSHPSRLAGSTKQGLLCLPKSTSLASLVWGGRSIPSVTDTSTRLRVGRLTNARVVLFAMVM